MASRITIYDNKLFLSGDGVDLKTTQPIFIGGFRRMEMKIITHGLAPDCTYTVNPLFSAYNDPFDDDLWAPITAEAGSSASGTAVEGVTTLNYTDFNPWLKLASDVSHASGAGNLALGQTSVQITLYEEK